MAGIWQEGSYDTHRGLPVLYCKQDVNDNVYRIEITWMRKESLDGEG